MKTKIYPKIALMYKSTLLFMIFSNFFLNVVYSIGFWGEHIDESNEYCRWEAPHEKQKPTSLAEYITATTGGAATWAYSSVCYTYYIVGGAYTSTSSPWVLFALNDYIHNAYDNIAEESAKNESGSQLYTITEILGCENESIVKFTEMMNKNYNNIFQNKRIESIKVAKKIIFHTKSNIYLSNKCII